MSSSIELKIYNSLTRQKEVFKPLNPPQVSVYVCGPTVYDFLHVGNFRGPVFFNMLRNYLELLGYEVRFALNFTDVDDKIIKKSNELKISAHDVSEKYIQEYKKDFQILGLKGHDYNPKVTESMDDIIAMIQKLIDSGYAYAQDGDVLYSIEKFSEYGKLSGRHPDELIAGARVEVDEKKRNPLDFALWKSAKPEEPSWKSPWGQGRPGWHIECSAMVEKIFGASIDIHGGGSDLIFPHHENEIAQSEACTHKTFVKYWMHWQMLNFSGQKMSKSLGNIISLREFVERYHPEIYKFMILSVHYRTVADFTEDAIHRSISSLAKIYSSLAMAQHYIQKAATEQKSDAQTVSIELTDKKLLESWDKIILSLSDDFNTAEMMAVIHEELKSFNQSVKRGLKLSPNLLAKCQQLISFFQRISNLTALFIEPPDQFLSFLDQRLIELKQIDVNEVEKLINERNTVRAEKNYKRSDEIRDQLNLMGISISDTPEGTYWEVTKNLS
ncbi:MAG: cysteine--tRNA ligase [Bdellovibrionales bacterium]|nr:cysteine--tRNA ligase [Bdellovibrionales bacterium]